jgi:hypothetical protein
MSFEQTVIWPLIMFEAAAIIIIIIIIVIIIIINNNNYLNFSGMLFNSVMSLKENLNIM